jgi:hypothetical protein
MYLLHYGSENHGPYVIEQIRSMWAAGIITADALFWNEATSAWEPVGGLLNPPPSIAAAADQATPPPLPSEARPVAAAGASKRSPKRASPWIAGAWLGVVLIILALVYWISAGSGSFGERQSATGSPLTTPEPQGKPKEQQQQETAEAQIRKAAREKVKAEVLAEYPTAGSDETLLGAEIALQYLALQEKPASDPDRVRFAQDDGPKWLTERAVAAVQTRLVTNMQLTPEEALAAIKGKPIAAKELKDKLEKSLVIVEGDKGKGSAAIINLKGNALVVTNVHVFSGNSRVKCKLLNSTILALGTIGIADDRDILVATQSQVKNGLEASLSVEHDVSIGDDVIVLGNSQGSGVVTEIKGKVSGIGPELIEVDAKFVEGNSGSPIIHVKTGKVIAIATFATIRKLDTLSKDSKFQSVRRFGYRLDTITKWAYCNSETFAAESEYVEQVKIKNDDLVRLALELSRNMRVTPSRYDSSRWTGSYVNILGKGMPPPGSFDYHFGIAAFRKTLAEFNRTLNEDLNNATVSKLAPFHRSLLEEEIRTRVVLNEFFKNVDWQQVRYSDEH